MEPYCKYRAAEFYPLAEESVLKLLGECTTLHSSDTEDVIVDSLLKMHNILYDALYEADALDAGISYHIRTPFIAPAGRQIRYMRNCYNETQKELAAKIGIDPKHLADIEMGRRKPSYEVMIRLAYYLEVDICYLGGYPASVRYAALAEVDDVDAISVLDTAASPPEAYYAPTEVLRQHKREWLEQALGHALMRQKAAVLYADDLYNENNELIGVIHHQRVFETVEEFEQFQVEAQANADDSHDPYTIVRKWNEDDGWYFEITEGPNRSYTISLGY